MKRRREGSDGQEPSPKRPAVDLERELAHQREKADLEKRAFDAEKRALLAEKRAVVEKAELEKRAFDAEKRAFEAEKRAAVEKAELEKRAFEAEKRAVLEKAELELQLQRRAFDAEKRALEAEKRAALEKAEFELKRQEKTSEAPSTLARARNYGLPWLCKPSRRLPEDLLRHITTFLGDDERFRIRRVSFTFYAAYFRQKIEKKPDETKWMPKQKFNSLRAIRLARRGRKFPNVQVLFLYKAPKLTKPELEAIGPFHFPALQILRLPRHPSLLHLPSNPSLTWLSAKVRDWQQLAEERFPGLRKISVAVTPGLELLPHSQIEEINMHGMPNWDTISKLSFPKLKRVKAKAAQMPQVHRPRLEGEGILVELRADD